jgi:SOS-response transcriptional repressor LexA
MNNNETKSAEAAQAKGNHIRPITEAQTKVLLFISKHIDEKQYPPSYRDISNELQFASTNAVTNHLQSLAKKGFIKTERGKARALVLTDKAVSHIKQCRKTKTN